MIALTHLGTVNCPTPACTYGSERPADIIQVGGSTLIVCQTCKGHHGYTGWTVDQIQARYGTGDENLKQQRTNQNPREKGDDDGVEYADPRDHRRGLE